MFEKTINKKISSLAESLGESAIIKDFYLAGGTALSLRLGHRKSRDLFFFTEEFQPATSIRFSCFKTKRENHNCGKPALYWPK
jgi:hypothetical protein